MVPTNERLRQWRYLDGLATIYPTPGQVAAWHLNHAIRMDRRLDEADSQEEWSWCRGQKWAHLDAADHFAQMG